MDNSNNGGGLKTILILVLLGVAAGWHLWTNGYIKLPDPQTPTPVVPVVIPAVVPTPALTQPEYIPTNEPTTVIINVPPVGEDKQSVDPALLADTVENVMQQMESCVRQQMADPLNNYHCEIHKDTLETLRKIGTGEN